MNLKNINLFALILLLAPTVALVAAYDPKAPEISEESLFENGNDGESIDIEIEDPEENPDPIFEVI